MRADLALEGAGLTSRQQAGDIKSTSADAQQHPTGQWLLNAQTSALFLHPRAQMSAKASKPKLAPLWTPGKQRFEDIQSEKAPFRH